MARTKTKKANPNIEPVAELKEVIINIPEVVAKVDVKVAPELVSEINLVMEISRDQYIAPPNTAKYALIENDGAGDVYYRNSTGVKKVLLGKEKAEVRDLKDLILYSYSRPKVSIRFYR
jgi:hypothetical protein